MHQKFLSLLLGTGLAVSGLGLGTAFAQTGCQVSGSQGQDSAASAQQVPPGQCSSGNQTSEASGSGQTGSGGMTQSESAGGGQTGGGSMGGMSAGQMAQMNPQAMAQQALRDWVLYTNRNWSIEGYSSATEMRQVEGNNQSDWMTMTEQMAGRTAAQIAQSPTTLSGQSSGGTAAGGNSGSGSSASGTGTSSSGTGAGSGSSGTGNSGTGGSSTGTNAPGGNDSGGGAGK